MLFGNVVAQNSPFRAVIVEETYFSDPIFVSSRALRRRSSQRALEEQLDAVSSHSFMLREGRTNELNFEIPTELSDRLEDIVQRPLLARGEGDADNAAEPETFLLFYHEELSGRVDVLVAVPSHAIGSGLTLRYVDDAVWALKEIEDFPCTELPLMIKNLRLWRQVFRMELTRGHEGFLSLPIPKILFEDQSLVLENTFKLWFDIGSGSLIMLKNSFHDAVGNGTHFQFGSDLKWSGMETYAAEQEQAESQRQKSLLRLPVLPAEWAARATIGIKK